MCSQGSWGGTMLPLPLPLLLLLSLALLTAVPASAAQRRGLLSAAGTPSRFADAPPHFSHNHTHNHTHHHRHHDLNSTAYNDTIIFQAFTWDSWKTSGGFYKSVLPQIQIIKDSNFTHVWLPPPSTSVSNEGYMPGQLYNLNSKYGTADQLRTLTAAINGAGMTSMADIVINHRCADEQTYGVWNKFRDDVPHPGARIDWGPWAITSTDPWYNGSGSPDTGGDFSPAPDLDHTSSVVRQGLSDWLQWLHEDVGFMAWRFDYSKGYAPRYVQEYINASLPPGSLAIGEYWPDLSWQGSTLDYDQDPSRKLVSSWIDGTGQSSAAFDFSTKGILGEAVKNTWYHYLKDIQGSAPGLIGWKPQRAVTFIDNHDTGGSQNSWPFPSSDVALGYAYTLLHPGIPSVWTEHFFNWGIELRTTIQRLIAIRRRNTITPGSQLQILCAQPDMYVARINQRVTVKLGPRADMGTFYPAPKDGWSMAASGTNWAVWELSPAVPS